MVQRVTVSPSEVRGYGDIVSPKTTEDFYEYRSVLTETDGVYTLSYETKGVSLSVDSESVEYGESVVLTALVRDEGLPASGETVTFYQGETLIYTGTTGDDGTVSYTVTGLAIGSYNFTAKYDIYTSNVVNVTVTKIDTSFTVNVTPTTFLHGQDVTISGVVNGVGSGANVLITSYPHSEIVASLTTETGGAFSTTVSNIPVGATRLYFSYVGDAYHEDALEIINVTVIDDTNYIELGVSGSSFLVRSNAFSYTGIAVVDWGDSSGLVEYTGNRIDHNYASSGNHTVKIYGDITTLKGDCFTSMTNLNTVVLPDSITGIYANSFENCTALTEIVLNWDSASEIIEYISFWISGCTSFDHFLIPEGTKSLYTAKNYPSNLLKEDGEPTPATITLTGTKNILSYADSESSVLTATVLDDNDDPVEGATVELYKDSVLWDTLTTGSAGTVSKTYTSAGVGDIGFTAECGSLVTEIFALQDCYRYNTLQQDDNLFSGSNINATYSSNGLTVTASASDVWYTYNGGVPPHFSVEYEVISLSGTFSSEIYAYGTGIGKQSNGILFFTTDINTRLVTKSGKTISPNDIVKLTYDGTNVRFYVNDELIETFSKLDNLIGIKTNNGRSITIKNLKIKPL